MCKSLFLVVCALSRLQMNGVVAKLKKQPKVSLAPLN